MLVPELAQDTRVARVRQAARRQARRRAAELARRDELERLVHARVGAGGLPPGARRRLLAFGEEPADEAAGVLLAPELERFANVQLAVSGADPSSGPEHRFAPTTRS